MGAPKHRLSGKEKLYIVWWSITQRCYNRAHKEFKYWGGRGIRFADIWRQDYLIFRQAALEAGYQEGLQIDRINVNGHYEPGNIRFVTAKEQQNNRRNNTSVTFEGRTQTISAWAEEKQMSIATLWARLNYYKWSIKDSFNVPISKGNSWRARKCTT